MKLNKENALKEWKERVYDDVAHVDPHEEIDWENLALGFFLGKGFDLGEATTLVFMASAKGWV